MGLKDIAKRMAESKAAGGGNYIQDGSGVLILKQAIYKDDAGVKGKDEIGVFEFLVESSEAAGADKFSDNGEDWKATPVTAPNKPGSACSFLCEFTQNEEVAFSKCKGLMLALTDESEESLAEAAKAKGDGATAESVAADLYMAAVEKSQPLRGARVKFSTYRTRTKAGKIITVPKFEPFPGQTEEMIKATRAKLDGAPEPEKK